MLDYKKYIELIKEGLIYTHNIQKYYGSLDIELNGIGVRHKINIISKFLYELEILNSNELNDDILEFVIDLNQNLLGYIPSYIWVENDYGINGFIFNEKYLSNNYKNIKIRFEAKYEDGLYKNDLKVPSIAYHLSPQSHKEKILKNGLYPKSKNRKSYYSERIYLFYDLSDCENLLKTLKFNDKINNINTNYILYKIKMNDYMIIHTDPNYDKGFYSYDNISPNDIEILKENL